MELLGIVLVVALCLLVPSLLLGGVRTAFFGLKGTLRPLEPKDGGIEDQARLLKLGASSDADHQQGERLSAASCPLHSAAYTGYALLEVLVPRDKGREVGNPVYHRLQIATCEPCRELVLKLWAEGFKWTRDNYDEHPQWASSLIIPYLLKDHYVQVSGFGLFETVGGRSGGDGRGARLSVSVPQATQEVVRRWQGRLSDGGCVHLAPNLPEKALRGALKSFASPVDAEDVLALVDITVMRGGGKGMVVTSERLYVHDEFFGVPKAFRLEEVESIELGKEVLINGRPTIGGVEGQTVVAVIGGLVASLRGRDPELGMPSPDAALPASVDPAVVDLLARWKTRIPSGSVFLSPGIPPEKRLAAFDRFAGSAHGEGILMLVDSDGQGMVLTLERLFFGPVIGDTTMVKIGEIRSVEFEKSLVGGSVKVNDKLALMLNRKNAETVAALLKDLLDCLRQGG